MEAVKSHGHILEYVVEPLKSDHEVVLAAVKSHGSLHHAAPSLWDDPLLQAWDQW